MVKFYLNRTWIHPDLFVKNSSIDHKGIFTKTPIKSGEKVMIFGGVIIDTSHLDESKYRMLSLFPIDDNKYIGLPVEDKYESMDEYLNHACDPNVWLNDEVTVVARRDIHENEEITMDCATWDSDPEWPYSQSGKCYCKHSSCRKFLSPNDWMKPELQEKYKGHFAPYIQKKIDKLKRV